MIDVNWNVFIGKSWLVETQGEAESGCNFRAFQSTSDPSRNCWIDVSEEKIHVDFEDWTDEASWDNTVHSLKLESIEILERLLKFWFTKDPELKEFFEETVGSD